MTHVLSRRMNPPLSANLARRTADVSQILTRDPRVACADRGQLACVLCEHLQACYARERAGRSPNARAKPPSASASPAININLEIPAPVRGSCTPRTATGSVVVVCWNRTPRTAAPTVVVVVGAVVVVVASVVVVVGAVVVVVGAVVVVVGAVVVVVGAVVVVVASVVVVVGTVVVVVASVVVVVGTVVVVVGSWQKSMWLMPGTFSPGLIGVVSPVSEVAAGSYQYRFAPGPPLEMTRRIPTTEVHEKTAGSSSSFMPVTVTTTP